MEQKDTAAPVERIESDAQYERDMIETFDWNRWQQVKWYAVRLLVWAVVALITTGLFFLLFGAAFYLNDTRPPHDPTVIFVVSSIGLWLSLLVLGGKEPIPLRIKDHRIYI